MNNNDLVNDIITGLIVDDSEIFKYADLLLEGNILVLNFQYPDEEDLKKTKEEREVIERKLNDALAFLSGINYAMDGLVKHIKNNIFMFAMKEVYHDPSIKKFLKDYSK